MNKDFCIVSYYTPEYADHAMGLMLTLKEFDLPHVMSAVPSRGSWLKNCAFKAQYCRWALDLLTDYNAIVYVDADARFRQYPTLFHYMDNYLISAYYRYNRELLSGTLYFKRHWFTQSLLNSWCYACNDEPNVWDQVTLSGVIAGSLHVVGEDKMYILPAEYCNIFDAEDQDCDPVIEHLQASRTLKNIVNSNE